MVASGFRGLEFSKCFCGFFLSGLGFLLVRAWCFASGRQDMDSAFILGRGGKTKHKIARVSGATLELHEHNCHLPNI